MISPRQRAASFTCDTVHSDVRFPPFPRARMTGSSDGSVMHFRRDQDIDRSGSSRKPAIRFFSVLRKNRSPTDKSSSATWKIHRGIFASSGGKIASSRGIFASCRGISASDRGVPASRNAQVSETEQEYARDGIKGIRESPERGLTAVLMGIFGGVCRPTAKRFH